MMQHDIKTAAVDTDFVNKLIESRLDYDENKSVQILIECLQKIFSDLKIKTVMHPLVYENELILNPKKSQKLFENHVIEKVEFVDVFNEDEAKKAYYIYLVNEFFRRISGEKLPFSGEDIFTKWVSSKSLGEVHSLAMCLIMPCGIFLSDDKGSKELETYIKTDLGENVEVYNRVELIDKHLQETADGLSRSYRRALTH